MAESKEELKSLLMRVKQESEKVGLKFKKLRSWHLVPSPHGKTEKEKVKAVTRFYFPGLQNYYGQ